MSEHEIYCTHNRGYVHEPHLYCYMTTSDDFGRPPGRRLEVARDVLHADYHQITSVIIQRCPFTKRCRGVDVLGEVENRDFTDSDADAAKKGMTNYDQDIGAHENSGDSRATHAPATSLFDARRRRQHRLSSSTKYITIIICQVPHVPRVARVRRARDRPPMVRRGRASRTFRLRRPTRSPLLKKPRRTPRSTL